MVIVMKPEATQEQITHMVERIEKFGVRAHVSAGEKRTVIGVIGDKTRLQGLPLEAMSGVENVMSISVPYKLTSREFRHEDTVIDVDGVKIGGNKIVMMAGPCAVETEEQLIRIAEEVKAAGASVLRGGAFKPRTTPYSFQGLGEEGLKLLALAKESTGLATITEVMSPSEVEMVARYSDILQIGTRNMQNFSLLKEVGMAQKPVMLKRGMSATIEDWLLAAEYILSNGNQNVMLCERGIRTYETYTRFTFDLNAIPVAKNLSHLPVIADPSHGTGRRELVIPMARAAVACGADGLIVEVHHDPENSWTSDGKQSLLPDQFAVMIRECKAIAAAIGREI